MSMADDAVDPTCYLAVLRALELAARRRRNAGRNTREAVPGVPLHLTHVHLPIAEAAEQLDRALAGAWQHLHMTLDRYGVERVEVIVQCVDTYTRYLLVYQVAPDPAALHTAIGARHDVDA